MWKRVALRLGTMALAVAITNAPIAGHAGIIEEIQAHFNSEPPTLTQVARMIDCIQEDILDQGTVVIKQPDVWSQARMTKFRKDFEDTMRPEINNFLDYLSGQLARSDSAAFASQTILGASLVPGTAAPTSFTVGTSQSPFGTLPNANSTANAASFTLLNAATAGTPGPKAASSQYNLSVEPNVHLDEKQDYLNHLNRLRRVNLGDDTADSAGYGLYLIRVPVSIQPGDKTVKGYGAVVNITMQHHFSNKFLQDTYRNLVINDVNDLLVPVVHELIRSGDAKLYRDYIQKYLKLKEQAKQASLSAQQAREQAKQASLSTQQAREQAQRAATQKNQATNEKNQATEERADLTTKKQNATKERQMDPQTRKMVAAWDARLKSLADVIESKTKIADTKDKEAQAMQAQAQASQAQAQAMQAQAQASQAQAQASQAQAQAILNENPNLEAFVARKTTLEELVKFRGAVRPVSRSGTRAYSIAPSDILRVMVPRNLLNLAYAVQEALDLGNSGAGKTNRINLVDVRSYLRQELESAFDLMEGRCHEAPPLLMDFDYIEKLTEQVTCRKFEGPKGAVVDSPREPGDFYHLYEGFTYRLPGNLQFRPIGVLCWAIALDAGLLNRQLREDMKDTRNVEGYTCPPDVDNLFFYAPYPTPETIAAFEDYVRAKWPMIAFALEPVVDQQNIEDAYTRRRDLQLAIAFALSSGQISFQQAMQFTRTLQYEAQTFLLNQTVAAFAHGNDTFGWRITPRFQTPPDESNLRAVTNLLLRGGPGPNYSLKNAKIEPGLRELNAVVIMPSFVRGLRVDAANNWFRLHDPDDFKLKTAHAVELGRRINEARLALDTADTCGLYRPQDIERLRTRLHQLEGMLPLQSASIKVPYQNTLGGFALFTQGASDLVPELDGYQGVEYIDPTGFTDIILYGRHFNIYETTVVVGGISLPRIGVEQVAAYTASTNKSTVVNTTLTSLKDPSGNLLLINPDGVTTTPVKDMGNYDILSREVLRLHIPPNVQTATREDNSVVVEMYVSTPNGLSNKVQIPVRPAAAIPAAAASKGPGYVLVDDNLLIQLQAGLSGAAGAYVAPPAGVAITTPMIRVQPINPPTPPAPMVDITLTFDTSIGTVSRTIQSVVWDGTYYTIGTDKLTAFALDLLALLQSNKLIPPPPPPAANAYLKTKSILVTPVGAAGGSTTLNPLYINLQANLVPGKTSALAPSASGKVVVRAWSSGLKAPGSQPASPPSLAQAATGTTIPLPNPPGLTRDPLVRPAGIETTLPAALAVTGQALPSISGLLPSNLPLPPQIEALTGQLQSFNEKTTAQLQTLNDKTAAQLQTLNDKTAALSSQLSTALNLQTLQLATPPGAPVVNVAVPVTNMPFAGKQHKGLFHRQPATPQNPTRPPLLQRMMNP